MSLLRRAKQETALIVALADLGGVFDLVAATNALSRAADPFVATALRAALAAGQRPSRLGRPGEPERNCGLVILALGKHGAMELNYSSDVDLVVFYDLQSPALEAGPGAKANALRLTQHLVKLLQERTGDGYVLRVDLRLRPDPARPRRPSRLTPRATITRRSARTGARGDDQGAARRRRSRAGLCASWPNWRPFIWRKYFDYAAIADIHAMKRQIHAVRAMPRSPSPAMMSNWGAAASARSNSSSRPSN